MLANNYLKEIFNLTDKPIYLVGRAVRDHYLGRETKKFDIVTKDSATLIGKGFADKVGGTLISLENKNQFSRAILHKEICIDFKDFKNLDIYEYLSLKDFTVNAMALQIYDEGIDYDNLIDPFNGLNDLNAGTIQEVSQEAFKNDPIRMLRAVRLMAELEFDINDNTLNIINSNSGLIRNVSGELITKELFKILSCKRAHYYFNLMDKYLNILNKIFPEIEPMKEVGRCKYHVVDSWTHSLHTMRVIENIIYSDGYFEAHLRTAYEKHMTGIYYNGHTRIQLIKLAALFHDIGKPGARWVDDTGRVRFRGHEIVGEEIMCDISNRLKLSNKEKKYLSKIVKEHMWPLTLYKTNDVSGKALYDLFKNFGEDTLDIIFIGLADIIATRQLLNPHEEMGMYKVHAEYLSNNYLTRFKEIEDISETISERDIVDNFGIEDRRIIGELLDSIKRAIFFGEIPLERDRIFKYISDKL